MKITNSLLQGTTVLLTSIIFVACTGNNQAGDAGVKDSAKASTDTAVQTPTASKPSLLINDGGTGGVPVIFLHSFGGSSRHWATQLEHLRKNRRAIAFDFRGHGQSPAPLDSNYTVEALAGDIAAVVDSLHLDKFILVGHSMGGAAAIAYAGKYPDKVKGLVLEGTPGKTPPERVEQIMGSLRSPKYDTVMKAYMKRLLKNARPFTDSIENAGMNQLSKGATIRITQANFDFDPVPDLKKYPGPVLIISTPSENQPGSLHSLFPTIQQEVVPNSSHWIQLDQPEKFNALLDRFLEKNG